MNFGKYTELPQLLENSLQKPLQMTGAPVPLRVITSSMNIRQPVSREIMKGLGVV